MRKTLAVLSAVVVSAPLGLASTAQAAQPTAAPAAAAAAVIAWKPCTDPSLASARAVCGYLSVPLDYAHPRGTRIKIAVSMVRHTVPAARYQGIMITNPGGPGGSGLGLAVLGQYVPRGVGRYYDWIGFDPRGVGSSIPALRCDPNIFRPDRPSYIPDNIALETTWRRISAHYAAACGKAGGALLKHVTTIDSAKDMDQIRLALHARQINYYGYSYGTYLGQVYATLFPTRVRRMVLDSNVDPRGVWYQANLDQDVAFERNIKIWFGWLARYNRFYHLGSTEKVVENRFYAEQNALERTPAGGKVGPDEWNDIFLEAGYYQSTWTDLAGAFSGWATTHGAAAAAKLVKEYEDTDTPGDDNGFAMYTATQCTDAAWPRSWATWRKDNWATFLKAPFETWSNAWYNAPCLTWPAAAHRPVKIDGSRIKSLLLIDQTLDAATPYEGSLYVRRLFPGARLLAEPGGTTHADSLDGNACVDDTVAVYLATGKLPARRPGPYADAFCKPLPQPVPTAAAAAAALTRPSAVTAVSPVQRLLRAASRPRN